MDEVVLKIVILDEGRRSSGGAPPEPKGGGSAPTSPAPRSMETTALTQTLHTVVSEVVAEVSRVSTAMRQIPYRQPQPQAQQP